MSLAERLRELADKLATYGKSVRLDADDCRNVLALIDAAKRIAEDDLLAPANLAAVQSALAAVEKS